MVTVVLAHCFLAVLAFLALTVLVGCVCNCNDFGEAISATVCLIAIVVAAVVLLWVTGASIQAVRAYWGLR